MRRSYSGASAATTDTAEEQSVEKIEQEVVAPEKSVPDVSEVEQTAEAQVSEENIESQPETETKEEPNKYAEIAAMNGIALGEMEAIAEYLRFVEDKSEVMRVHSTLMLGGAGVALFSLAGLIMMLLGKLPEKFTTMKVGLILGAIFILATLVVVFAVKKTMKYLKMEGFKEIGFIEPMQIADTRRRENAPNQWLVRLNNTNETYWFDSPMSYRTKMDINGKTYKIRVNTHIKVGMEGYLVRYRNRFNQQRDEFIIFG